MYAVGGAQAIAALAYGTESVSAVDKIVGPGNRWVTAAKLLVSGRVGIDLPAGPSEVVVVADETADAELCAADLLAQAEHGPDSECLLVTTSAPLAQEVASSPPDGSRCGSRWSHRWTRRWRWSTTTRRSIWSCTWPIRTRLAGRVTNAGSIFLGATTPAVVGDYAVGANHVLPTGGLARAAGGLGLEAFLKPVQIVAATREGLDGMRETVAALAAAENLPLHAAAVEARFRGERRRVFRRGSSPTSGRVRPTRSPRPMACRPAEVLRFDANVPPLPGVPSCSRSARASPLSTSTRRAPIAICGRPRQGTQESSRRRSWSAPARTT